MSYPRTAYIAYGANLGDPRAQFERSLDCLRDHIGDVTCKSSLYATDAMNPPGMESQPVYLNAVVAVSSRDDPQVLLEKLQRIEEKLGLQREKKLFWGPRVIDLDFIALDDLVFNSNELSIPHPRLHERDFVLVPLAEIAPDWVHPLFKRTALELLRAFECSDMPRYIRAVHD